MATTKVLIGIQARSTSTRLPRKIFLPLGDKLILDHVIDAAKNAASYVEKYSSQRGCAVAVSVLCPEGDSEIKETWGHRVTIYEGPEDDVLTRYALAMNITGSDYLIRLTSDCPLIPPHVISKHINTLTMMNLDYVSNIDPRVRTSFDGEDCEGMSKRLLEWLNINSSMMSDREHVTPLIRKQKPDWARVAQIIGYRDLSALKLSLDTMADYKEICKNYESVISKIEESRRLFGKNNVHRF